MDNSLNILGWIFMITSLGFVIGLAIYCYRRVLTAPKEPAAPVQEFHSA